LTINYVDNAQNYTFVFTTTINLTQNKN